MKDYRRILFATDFSEASKNALGQAAALAARHGAELHLLHVNLFHEHNALVAVPPSLANYREELDRAARQALDRLAPELEVPVVKAVGRGHSAAPVILDYARAREIDLIVVGSHNRKGVSHLFLGSVAQEVVRAAPIPVLVAGRHAGSAHGRIRHILAGVDFSDTSLAALRQAGELARRHDAALLVVHVIDLLRLPPYYTHELETVRHERALKELEAFIARAELPVQVTPLVSSGIADENIVQAARDHDVQWIVLGASGMSGVGRLLVGSVAERVTRHARCAVLIYRPAADPDSSRKAA